MDEVNQTWTISIIPPLAENQAAPKTQRLNQTELAQMLKKSLRTVQKYETGEIEVSIAVVNQIADLLDTTSTYILGYESSTTQIRTLAT